MLFRLALRSMLGRFLTVGLTVAAIGLSVTLLLGVERIRTSAKVSFTDTISSTDLIVGARSGSVQLLLYSVFRIGSPTNNMSWQSFEEVSARPEVEWAIPLSLGDSHRGFPVLGTTDQYFERYKYRQDAGLVFREGRRFEDLFEVVVGADVASDLDYALGDQILVAHGMASFSNHAENPFTISGILEKTGTPTDRTVFVSLPAIEAIHVGWQGGAVPGGNRLTQDQLREMEFEPESITAAMIGVHTPLQIFNLQRWVNEFSGEPLMALIPGVALQELWQIVGVAESALLAVSIMVVTTAFLGMAAMIFSSLNERRREMAIFRGVGASPAIIAALLMLEAFLTTLLSIALGVGALYAALAIAQPSIDATYGIFIPIEMPSLREIVYLLIVLAAGTVVSLFPALRAYRLSVADGMTVRV